MTAQNSKGFEITLHEANHLIRVRTWGYWDRELAKTCGNALEERIDSICERGEEWNVLVDVTALRPQTEDVQRIMREQIETASQRGIKKIAYLGTGETFHLRFELLFQEAEPPQYAFFEMQGDAVHWLLSE